ncbi:transcriptional regulator [Methanonatronarchaeum sp. AMET6-2]|uniref:transcriptional regulator n=1 Tax=Methanonatronarchaeum sp. AMET6-2 TaxID=2933293 RepID=UPI001208E988|nr:helix-turn-helix domain-containing protein [Methanonatronarchaeum sp. AMET6-2]RZN62896.1 MAG: helix-turn-helix domain-containing protein [Methanonatronarchaeia archaeon]UOY09826.1 helix-turn-helix domain-containing protein [Methanonatronarchaeum sp. AMET6-2]
MPKQPCEIIVLHILPSVRAQIAKDLVEMGMSQQKVSEIIGITPAAISQYVSGKRGYEMEFEGEVREKIREFARKTYENGDADTLEGICDICDIVKEQGILCELYEKHEEDPEKCGSCKFQTVCACG